MDTRKIAYQNGVTDGTEAAVDAIRGDPDVAAVRTYVEGWFRPGVLSADEGLINACDAQLLASVLGLTPTECDARGERFRTACSEYNRGYETGARAALATICEV